MQNLKHQELTPEQKWEQATLADSFIFYKVMKDHPDACKKLLEILLDIKIDTIQMSTEETIFLDPQAKGIRLDLCIKGSDKIFAVEMQALDTKELPERARYYQSAMDIDMLKSGELYSQLKESHVIFICINDIFKQGLPIYTFKNICQEDRKTPLNDRTTKHFFIAENCDKILKDEEKKAFLNFILTNTAKTEYTKDLLDYVENAKQITESRRKYMEWERQRAYDRQAGIEVGLAKGLEEGLAEGRLEGQRNARIESAENALNIGIPIEDVSKITGLSLEEVEELAKKVNVTA